MQFLLQSIAELRVDFACRDNALVELRLLFALELDVDNLFEAILAEHDGNADAEFFLAVLPFEVDTAGNDLLRIKCDCLDERGCRCAGRIPCGRAEQPR